MTLVHMKKFIWLRAFLFNHGKIKLVGLQWLPCVNTVSTTNMIMLAIPTPTNFVLVGQSGHDRTAQNTVIWFTFLWHLCRPYNINVSLAAVLQVNILRICHGCLMEPYVNMHANFSQPIKVLLFQILPV